MLLIRLIGVAVLCAVSFVLGMLFCQRGEDEALAISPISTISATSVTRPAVPAEWRPCPFP
jgi:hypothetical protein